MSRARWTSSRPGAGGALPRRASPRRLARGSALAGRVRLTAVEQAARPAPAGQARGCRRAADPAIGRRVSAKAIRLRVDLLQRALRRAPPVVRVVRRARRSRRSCASAAGCGGFAWVRALASPRVSASTLAPILGVTLETGPGRSEIPFAAAPGTTRLARALARGCLVAFDYGHRARGPLPSAGAPPTELSPCTPRRHAARRPARRARARWT